MSVRAFSAKKKNPVVLERLNRFSCCRDGEVSNGRDSCSISLMYALSLIPLPGFHDYIMR